MKKPKGVLSNLDSDRQIVSIITPCYNGGKHLTRYYNSIINQTYRPLELVFINDGSTDSTASISSSFSDRLKESGISFVYIEQENAGQAAAVNNGLKLASGEYISLLDSDDTISPEFIQTKVDYLALHPESAFCYGPAEEVTDDVEKRLLRSFGKRSVSSDRSFFEDVLNSRGVFFSGYLFRASALDKAIPEREIYSGRGGQNAQLLLPMGWYYGEPSFVEGAVYTYYNHYDSHSHSLSQSPEQMIELLNSYEAIMTETVAKISDPKAQKYIPGIKKRYARLRYGHALDTKNGVYISRSLKELRKNSDLTIRDLYLAFRYSNKIINYFFPVD